MLEVDVCTIQQYVYFISFSVHMATTSIQNDLNLCTKQTRDKAVCLREVAKLCGMNIKPYETLRTKDRQQYLYSIGRTKELNRKPVTRTLNSLHLWGKAIDRVFVVDGKVTRSGDRAKFWRIAMYCGFDKIPQESCHTQNDGKKISEVMSVNSDIRIIANARERYVLKAINEQFIKMWY